MTSKERAHLKSLASKIPALYQVGKEGITENMKGSISDALAARELIKVHTLETSPLTAREAAEALALYTESQVVQVIGRKFVLYKPEESNPNPPEKV